jgi:hypothetical protein
MFICYKQAYYYKYDLIVAELISERIIIFYLRC